MTADIGGKLTVPGGAGVIFVVIQASVPGWIIGYADYG
jgi:hypothetical protein